MALLDADEHSVSQDQTALETVAYSSIPSVAAASRGRRRLIASASDVAKSLGLNYI